MNEPEEIILLIKKISFDVTDDTYDVKIRQGYELLVKLRDIGLKREHVYQPLIQYHNSLSDGLPRDYIAELLDYVVGWCCPQNRIWNT